VSAGGLAGLDLLAIDREAAARSFPGLEPSIQVVIALAGALRVRWIHVERQRWLGSRRESRPERTPRFLRRKGIRSVVEGEPARASEEALARSAEDEVNYGPG
jgi:hypothetical protein